MKGFLRFTAGLLLFGFINFPAPAAFTSLYVFGDGVCTTTNGPGGSSYHSTNGANGKRYTNGRVWIEVLAQRQGLSYEPNKNWSYFGHYSEQLLTNLSRFTAPTNANTALFVVWVNDADFVGFMFNPAVGNPDGPTRGTNLTAWNNALNQSLTNHWKAITNLYYAKGVRTLIMPNAVDVMKVPYFAQYANASFVRQRIIDFNTQFSALLNLAKASLTNLTLYQPDVFSLLDDVVAHAANYGLTNTLDNLGYSIDALADPALANKSLNGPGTNYVFWDNLDPTAKFHMHIADYVQQFIWPTAISNLTSLNGSNRLDMVNIPIGRNGVVEGRTNLLLGNWTAVTSFNSTNATQSVWFPAAEPVRFYRLRFPFVWTWP